MAETDEPTQIGPYRIQKRLGQGAMGFVYQAVHETLERQVALKILPAGLADNEEFILRFQREAKAAAALRHPHIVEVYDAGLDQGRYFIAMELVAGRSLGDLLKERGCLEEAEGLRLLREAAAGLSAAHSKGIIHRDIKPDNLLLEGDRTVRIADFGLVRELGSNRKLTVTGAMMGTPAYLSPEQAGGEPAEARSDLYSLGCTFYRALTGHPVFASESAMSVIFKHRFEKPADPRTHKAALSENAAYLLLSMLGKNPKDRPASAQAVCEAIDSIQSGAALPRPAWMGAAPPAPTRSSAPASSRVLWIALTAGIFLLALTLFGVLAVMNSGGSQEEPVHPAEPAQAGPVKTHPTLAPDLGAQESKSLQPDPDLSAEQREEWGELLEIGHWAMAHGKYRQARANFILALRIKPGEAQATEGLRQAEEKLKAAEN
ncbi:MAG: serine/threonine protein kinase [Planctomycetes bacterium]|nr:serine/threonine protein kinase [Planctomycetota bacterium]